MERKLMVVVFLLFYEIVHCQDLNEVLKEIQNLKNENNRLKTKLIRMEDMIQSKMTLLESKCESDFANLFAVRQRRIVPPSSVTVTTEMPNQNTVAFFAIMHNSPENLGLQQTVEFQNVVTNEGQGYDAQSSIFKAPLSGVYYFTSNVMTWWREDIEVELVKRGVGQVFTYIGNGDAHAVGTLSAVLRLEAGDDIWIRVYNNKGVNDGNVRIRGGASWFSGFQISK